MILDICRWLAGTAIGTGIRESDNLFSVIETVHVLGIMFTAGTIALVDMRLLGLLLTRYPVVDVLAPLVKITWVGFSVMASSGALLFWSEADKLYFNWAFRLKLALLLLAAVNQWRFQQVYSHDFAGWTPGAAVPVGARFAARVSLGLWLGIIVFGRAIAYL